MSKDEQICSKCRRRRISAGPATLTQWMVQHERCSCDRVNVPSTTCQIDRQSETVFVCRNCSKRIEEARKGSLTQWIFESHLCACKVPVPIETDVVTIPERLTFTGASEPIASSSQVDVELELELADSDFPADRYAPLLQLGTGASGTVYLCRDRLLGIKVAIKILHRVSSEQLLQFQQEARVVAKMDHPSIVRLLDFGPTPNGTPYMVLEYFQGRNLEEILGSERLTLKQLIEIFSKIAQGVSHAHSHGIFHRDLKPSNVLLSFASPDSVEVKIIDFGLSRLESGAEQSNTIAGTPQFMPPDVLLGLSYDETSEVYALGCMLFFAITGTPPYVGGTALETMSMHAHQPIPDILENRPSIPYELKQFIELCIAKRKEERFRSIDEFKSALRQIPVEEMTVVIGGTSFAKAPEQHTHHQNRFSATRVSIVMLSLVSLAAAIGWVASLVGDRRENSGAGVSAPKGELTVLEKHVDVIGKRVNRAQTGDAEAQEKLGDMYYQGQSIARDLSKAFEYYKAAAHAGRHECLNKIGWMQEHGEGTMPDIPEALNSYRAAAKYGSSASLQNLARLLFSQGMRANDDALLKERIGVLNQLSAMGDGNAKYWLAHEYRRGKFVPLDYKRSDELLNQAAKSGATKAYSLLGAIENEKAKFSRGPERASHKAKARTYFDQAPDDVLKKVSELGSGEFARLGSFGPEIEQEYLTAARLGRAADMIRIADYYMSKAMGAARLKSMAEYKSSIPDSFAKALFWYKKAASANDPIAQNNLGFMYDNGLGVKRNNRKAFELFKLAADAPQGELLDPYALVNLGLAYEFGRGTNVDYKEAVKWYQMGADARNSEAEYRLALMYKRGLGVPRNEQMAASWLKKAAFRKHEQANRILYKSEAPDKNTASFYDAKLSYVMHRAE